MSKKAKGNPAPAPPKPMTPAERKEAARLRHNARRRAATAALKGITVQTVETPTVEVRNGRPPIEVTTQHLLQVQEAAGYGLTVRMIARVVFGCTDTTLREICRRDPRVSDALETGHSKAAFNIGQALYNRAKGGDIQAIKYYENTRQGRAERVDVTLTGTAGNPILTEDVSGMDEATKLARIAEIVKLGRQRQLNAMHGKP